MLCTRGAINCWTSGGSDSTGTNCGSSLALKRNWMRNKIGPRIRKAPYTFTSSKKNPLLNKAVIADLFPETDIGTVASRVEEVPACGERRGSLFQPDFRASSSSQASSVA